MHTQNVNVKVAGGETAGRWGEKTLEQAHDEALIIDAEINRLVSERQLIDLCSYDDRTEMIRLASWKAFNIQADRIEVYGLDLLKWIRRTALTLWENGFDPHEEIE
ncbi:hypothetical protein ACFH4J_003388 [Escherichia coli]|uniref:hypothetical protein n=1 Tax=Enterobacter hormaechei TaxID=158836 RepID=UPI0027D2FFF1|nr:hypothetical protein [Enterobacter hormaechei]WLZ51950.1 hypothetical protein QPR65_22720 [Enterobacter hormaechei]